MVQINVSNGQGITQAIKAQVQADGGTISNNTLSVWQQVMSEVKNAQEGGAQIYTGGDDVEKLNDHSNWQTDFKVMAGQVIELAQDVWNKIVQLLTGQSAQPETVAEPQVVEQAVEEVAKDEKETTEQAVSQEPEVSNDAVSVTGSSQTLTKEQADALVQETLGQPLPEDVEVSFIMSNNDIIPTFKRNGQPVSADELKKLVTTNVLEPPLTTGPIKGENDDYDKIVQEGAKQVSSMQGHLSPEQLEEFLANDTTYQGYDAQLKRMDDRMTEIEKLYNMPKVRDRFKDAPEFGTDEWQATFNIFDQPEHDEYTSLGLDYSSLNTMLGKYKTVMQDWTDGPCVESSFFQRNGKNYTNLERITLEDGRRAWKTDQGTFLPAPDGMPGGKRIE